MMPAVPFYAIWHQRLAAYLIDAFLLLIPSVMIVVAMGTTNAQSELVPAPISSVFVFLLNAAYYVFFTAGPWQASPGMRLMHLRLVRTNGRPLTQLNALERFLALIMPSLAYNTTFLSEQAGQTLVVFLHMIWFIPILTTRIGLHDRLCHMRVISGKYLS